MGRRRGFLAELQYLNQQAEKRRRQQEAAASRARAAAQREAERALRAAARGKAAAVAANARERDRLEKEAAHLHVESQMAEVASLNAGLAQAYEEIDGILAATLSVDDYVDLEALKITAVAHPPFDPGLYATPNPPVPPPVYPPQPVYREPAPPPGLLGVKKKHAEHIALARAEFERAQRAWQDQNGVIYAAYGAKVGRREEAERARLAQVAGMQVTYRSSVLSPATGLRESVPLVVVAAGRETFGRFDLSNVVPLATLEHLAAAVSRSPFDLTPADTSRGVRVRGR